jgi:hypothetical protein
MNTLERRMLNILKDLKENHGAIGIRTEFEAEGTRLEEILRLKEISMLVGLGLTLKIGGCESIRDMLEARTIGVDCLVAPMIESGYAMKKYLQAVSNVFPPEELNSVEIFSNIETITATNYLDEILEIPEIRLLQGIVIERIDLCFSLSSMEEDVNDEKINEIVLRTTKKAKEKNLLTVIGGGLSAHSLPFFRSLPEGFLNRYETRKVTFKYPDAIDKHPEKGILKALGFELLWLRNKMTFYRGISIADEERMNVIEQNYWFEIESLI